MLVYHHILQPLSLSSSLFFSHARVFCEARNDDVNRLKTGDTTNHSFLLTLTFLTFQFDPPANITQWPQEINIYKQKRVIRQCIVLYCNNNSNDPSLWMFWFRIHRWIRRKARRHDFMCRSFFICACNKISLCQASQNHSPYSTNMIYTSLYNVWCHFLPSNFGVRK